MEYSPIDGRVVRDDGYVAVQHYTSAPTNIKVAGVVYIFLPRLNVSMCWVHPDHVNKILGVRVTGG